MFWVGMISSAAVLRKWNHLVLCLNLDFLCVFFSFYSICVYLGIFVSIGWIDHMYLVMLFGRETEKDKGMLLEYIHFVWEIESNEWMSEWNIPIFLYDLYKLVLKSKQFYITYFLIIEVDHVVLVIVDDEVQVHDQDQDHHHLKVNFNK